MQISPAKKQKLKANLGKTSSGKASFEDLHPRYPAGHPQGGKFMPKGGNDYVKAVAKNTGKTPQEVKASLGGDAAKTKTSTKTQSPQKGSLVDIKALPPEAAKELQANTGSLNAALQARQEAEQKKLNAVKGTKREAGKAFTAAKKEVSAKQKAVEAVLIKHGASKQRAKEIAEKLITQKVGQAKDGGKPIEKPLAEKVKAKPVEVKAPPVVKAEPEKKSAAIAPKSTKVSSKVKAQKIPIEEFNTEIEGWSKYTKGLSDEEKKDIPNIRDNIGIISNLLDDYGAFKAIKDPSVANFDHLIVRDSKGLTQSALVYEHSKDKGFKVEFLATAPWNLQKDHPNKQKGSGAKAITEAIKKSKELGYGGKISLYALKNAEPFYKHLGFEEEYASGGLYTLNSKAANELLKKYGA